MKILVAPSILSADFGNLTKELAAVKKAGADLVHVDIMDGHFVPNITIGPVVVKDIRRATTLPLDVHLMIERPEKFVEAFCAAGADMVTVHIEAAGFAQMKKMRSFLKSKGKRFGVSLNPATPLERIVPSLGLVDLVLVMSVNPGFGGQAFIPSVLAKIRRLRGIFKGDISVDGGINDQTAAGAVAAGANILAAGSYIFKARSYSAAIRRLRCAGKDLI